MEPSPRELREAYLTRVENRWLRRLQGVLPGDTSAGEFDLYVQMAMRFKWTPEQVNALDPQYLEELLAYLAANARHAEKERKDAEAKARQARAGK